ncbi:MAG: SpoIIE family protein phosphatase [SAR324 cluster bacterium]|nr:SpoIIE family protein phosphatase [SAR324 cluster bacterium]
MKTHNLLKHSQYAHLWNVLLVLEIFFLIGYLGVLGLIYVGLHEILLILTGLVFFSGALFVYLVIYLGKVSLEEMKSISDSLEQTVETRTQALNKSQKHLEKIQNIAREVSAFLDIKQATQVFIEQTVQAMRADGSGSIMLYREADNSLYFYAAYGLDPAYVKNFIIPVEPGKIYTYDVFKSQRSKIFNEEELKPYQNESTHKLHYQRYYLQQLVVPLVSQDKTIGLITISHYDADHLFQKEDQLFLESLAQNLSHHFENASTYDELRKKEEVIGQLYLDFQIELYQAAEFQQQVLSNIPKLPYFNTAIKYVPHSQVSGDTYVFARNREGAVNIFLGDATGHGISAAFMTMIVNIGIESIAPHLSTDEIIRRLNKILTTTKNTGRSITGIFSRISPDGTLLTTNAGHYPLMILPADGSPFVQLKGEGLGLGLFDEELLPWTEDRYQLQDGDTVLLYTDGILEWEDKNGNQFEMARMLKILEEYRHFELDTLLSKLFRAAQLFADGQSQSDDITLIGLQYISPKT